MERGIPARDRLRLFRAERRLTQAELGRMIGRHGPAVSDYENGKTLPDLVCAARIERLTGIPASSWVPETQVGGEAA